jgi:5-methyltetrahydropteroyltriglutamate--homocysteine methyltransferase
VHEAARYLPLERLAISPQCGFATSIVGNNLSPEEQRRKLEVLCATARQVWG